MGNVCQSPLCEWCQESTINRFHGTRLCHNCIQEYGFHVNAKSLRVTLKERNKGII